MPTTPRAIVKREENPLARDKETQLNTTLLQSTQHHRHNSRAYPSCDKGLPPSPKCPVDTKSNVKRPLIEIRHPHNLQINTQVSEGQSATSGGGHEPGKRACQEFVCRSQKGDDKHTKSLKMDTSSRSRKFMPKVGANDFLVPPSSFLSCSPLC